jgi:transposase
MPITAIGLDPAKHVFQPHGVDAGGRVVLRRRLSRPRVLAFLAGLPPCRVGMEACGGAHFWAGEIGRPGHEVRLMPASRVRPCVKRNRHDAADAAAICEAVTRPGRRFVPIRGEDRQGVLPIHRGPGAAGPAAHPAGRCPARAPCRIRGRRGEGHHQAP